MTPEINPGSQDIVDSWVDGDCDWELTTNTNEVSILDKISVDPNPGYVIRPNIPQGVKIERILVVNSEGKEVLIQDYQDRNNKSIDMGNQPNGLYYIQFVAKEGMTVKKRVKQGY